MNSKHLISAIFPLFTTVSSLPNQLSQQVFNERVKPQRETAWQIIKYGLQKLNSNNNKEQKKNQNEREKRRKQPN